MPTREEMQSLADEIVRSYEDRIAGIAQLRETVKVVLKGFHDSRMVMGRELRADLAKGVADVKAAVGTQLKELDAAHATMSRELKADLAKVHPTLTEEDKERRSEAREFRGELVRVVGEGKAAVEAQLREFDRAHKAMSQEMRAELVSGRKALAQGEKKRQSESREFKGELAKVVAEDKAATRALLREFADMQAGARDEWQTLTVTMQAHRGLPAVEVSPPEPAVPPVEEVAEEAVAIPGAAEITPELSELHDRVFQYVANHPDGVKMTDLEDEFGLSRIQMARTLKSLMDENKVEKRGLLYLAI